MAHALWSRLLQRCGTPWMLPIWERLCLKRSSPGELRPVTMQGGLPDFHLEGLDWHSFVSILGIYDSSGGNRIQKMEILMKFFPPQYFFCYSWRETKMSTSWVVVLFVFWEFRSKSRLKRMAQTQLWVSLFLCSSYQFRNRYESDHRTLCSLIMHIPLQDKQSIFYRWKNYQGETTVRGPHWHLH